MPGEFYLRDSLSRCCVPTIPRVQTGGRLRWGPDVRKRGSYTRGRESIRYDARTATVSLERGCPDGADQTDGVSSAKTVTTERVADEQR